MKQHIEKETSELVTEQSDQRFMKVASMSVGELAELMNSTDAQVHQAVGRALPAITSAIEKISQRFQSGGRLIYVGAGTSGRIATLDASEIYPTFGIEGRVIALMAGGQSALVNPAEGAEDDLAAGKDEASSLHLDAKDTLVGVASSGSTPYVLGAMETAKAAGALVVSLTCNSDSKMSRASDLAIEVVVGPEFLAGSTRLKAGSAQKMVLNMISTITMMKAGKTYGNLMVDVVASNAKLRKRAIRILREIEHCDASEAQAALKANNWNVKVAVVAHRFSISSEEAVKMLEDSGGYLAKALGELE